MIIEDKIIEQFTDDEYDEQSRSFYASMICFKHVKKLDKPHKITLDNGLSVFVSVHGDSADMHVAMRSIESELIDDLCDYLFETYNLTTIFIDHLYNEYKSRKYHPIKTGVNSDVYMGIPSSIDEYNQLLGKKTRKHIKYYRTRLEREFDKVEYSIFKGDEISYEMIERMFRFNIDRLAKAKGINKQFEKSDVDNVYNCIREKGALFTLSINGSIEAFTVLEEIGGDYWLTDIGSNPEYDFYNIGQVSLYNSICYAIEHKKHEDNRYHFMFELTDYKKRFGGHMVELYPYLVCRNRGLTQTVASIRYGISEKIMYQIKRYDKVKGIIQTVRSIKH